MSIIWTLNCNLDSFVRLLRTQNLRVFFMQRLISIGGELERERERVRKRRSNHRDRGEEVVGPLGGSELKRTINEIGVFVRCCCCL